MFWSLQDDVLESPVSSEWPDDDDDVIKASPVKKKSKISQFGHEIGQLVETDMALMVAPEKKRCSRSEGCTKYKKSSYHDGYCLSCYIGSIMIPMQQLLILKAATTLTTLPFPYPVRERPPTIYDLPLCKL